MARISLKHVAVSLSLKHWTALWAAVLMWQTSLTSERETDISCHYCGGCGGTPSPPVQFLLF